MWNGTSFNFVPNFTVSVGTETAVIDNTWNSQSLDEVLKKTSAATEKT